MRDPEKYSASAESFLFNNFPVEARKDGVGLSLSP
jgi:hypothetical protein